jgi:serine/threonine-protein phosphatase 2A activator
MQTETIPELPNILSTYTPKEPVSRIHEQKDIDEFLKTKAFDRIMTFVMLLNQSVLKKKISDPCIISPVKMSK